MSTSPMWLVRSWHRTYGSIAVLIRVSRHRTICVAALKIVWYHTVLQLLTILLVESSPITSMKYLQQITSAWPKMNQETGEMTKAETHS